jgi:acyl dehydratase
MSIEKTTTDLAGLRDLVGQPVGVGGWRSITQEDIATFAEVTGDRQWIHLDPERAKVGRFGGPIAHGFLTLSHCAPILEETLEVTGEGMRVNYGVDRVRFPAPVPAGGEIRGHVSLTSVKDLAGGGLEALFRIDIELSGSEKPEKPVCVADLVLRFYR